MGYETWPPIGWRNLLWLVGRNKNWNCLSHNGLRAHAQRQFPLFFRGHWQSSFTALTASTLPAIKAVQGDCERVYLTSHSIMGSQLCHEMEVLNITQVHEFWPWDEACTQTTRTVCIHLVTSPVSDETFPLVVLPPEYLLWYQYPGNSLRVFSSMTRVTRVSLTIMGQHFRWFLVFGSNVHVVGTDPCHTSCTAEYPQWVCFAVLWWN